MLGKEDAWVIRNSEQFIGFECIALEQKFATEFEILFIEEFKGDKPLANGALKFWHLYTLILKKKP